MLDPSTTTSYADTGLSTNTAYYYEVQCVATVYSVYNGAPIISFTQIGGSASDIDTGGTGNGDSANAGSGATGIPMNPPIIIKDANDDTLNNSLTT